MGALLAVVVLVVSLVRPELFAQGLSGLTGKDRADVLGSGRDFGLKLAAGVGAVTAALLAWGRFELSKEERDVARMTLDAQRLTIDAQRLSFDAQRLTGDAERFARAVDQLGSEKGAEVVLGGLYALEALAVSATGYQSQITEVLSAFVREHVRDRDTTPTAGGSIRDLKVMEQAALTILGRHPSWRGTIDLTGANLRGANLTNANFSRANLFRANLSAVDLTDANLTGAQVTMANFRFAMLSGADLTKVIAITSTFTNANLPGADLSGAVLGGADLSGVNLYSAVLASADLSDATFTDANLTGAVLADANLSSTNLAGADLSEVNLTGAKWRAGKDPTWPSGFKPLTLAKGDYVSISGPEFDS